MSLTLPPAPPAETHTDLPLDDRHLLRLDTVSDVFGDGTVIEVQCCLVIAFPNVKNMRSCAYLISGLGSTSADAFLAMFADEDVDGLRIPPAVAQAIDELGRQSVRIVCNRLSGGQLESTSKPDADGFVVVSVGIKAKLA